MSANADTTSFDKRNLSHTDIQRQLGELIAAIKAGTSIRVDVFCRTKGHACRSVLSKSDDARRAIKAAAVLRVNNMPVVTFVYINEVNHLKLPRVVSLH